MSRERFIAAQQAVLGKHGVSAESQFIEVPAMQDPAHVLIAGSGSPLVMINGAGTPAAMFAPLMAHLTGYRIYAIDHPAHGLSGQWNGFAEDLAGNSTTLVQCVLDELVIDRASFLGNSFGSRLIFWLADAAPDRIISAVHVGCPALALDTSAPLPMRIMATRVGPLLTRLTPPSAFQVTQLAKMVKEHPLSTELTELLVATELQDGFAETLRGIHRAFLSLGGARPDMSLTANELAAVQHRVQFIWGADDPFGSPDVGRRIADVIGAAEFHLVPGGHAPWLRFGEQVADHATAFLGSTSDA